MNTLTNESVVCLITRYNEQLDWLRYIIDSLDLVVVYNKGSNNNLFKFFKCPPEKIIVQNLPNIGRIDHSIAHFILENWDNLPETLISLPGSVMMCKMKGYYLNAINKKLKSKLFKKYSGFFAPRFHKISPKFNYTINEYQAEGICNRNNNPFIKSEYTDFQEWKKALIDDRPMRYVGMRGMFIVAKENIRHIKKEIYNNLLVSLSVGDNIENGHFAERIWAHLFRQYSFDSKIENSTETPEGVCEEL